MPRLHWLTVGVLGLLACSPGPGAGALPAPDAGLDGRATTDAGGDVHADTSSESGGDTGAPDAAPLPACDHGKTCALPLICDETDLLCEPPCDATQTCAPNAFCRPNAPGSPSGTCIGADYLCLGNVPSPPAPTTSALTVTATFVDTSSGKGTLAPNLTVNACAKSDAACSAPVAVGATTANGVAFMSLPAGTSGFDGYFDVTGPSSDGGAIMETLIFSSVPVTINGNIFTATVESPAALQKDLSALGMLDPTRAHVMVIDDACRSTPAFGASLTISTADAATSLGYVGPSGIVAGATSFPTSNAAVAYAVNVPDTSTTLTTTHAGQLVNKLAVALRPHVLVTAYLAPTP